MSEHTPIWLETWAKCGPAVIGFALLYAVFYRLAPYVEAWVGDDGISFIVLFAIWAIAFLVAIIIGAVPIAYLDSHYTP